MVSALPDASSVEGSGRDATRPELAPGDRGFVDTRDGWGWSDRCWASLGEGRLGHARAQCEQGLTVAPDPGPPDGARPSLLYNLGLVAERSGDLIEARRRFERSLALRTNDEVVEALRRVGGVWPPAAGAADPSPAPTVGPSHGGTPGAATTCTPCATQEDFDAAMRGGSRCCPVIACQRDAECPVGRVCCRIPDGQLCGDAARCTDRNRVDRP